MQEFVQREEVDVAYSISLPVRGPYPEYEVAEPCLSMKQTAAVEEFLCSFVGSDSMQDDCSENDPRALILAFSRQNCNPDGFFHEVLRIFLGRLFAMPAYF